MPRYRYTGSGPCRYGAKEVHAGDVVDASAQPGKNFVLVVEESKPEPSRRHVVDEVEKEK